MRIPMLNESPLQHRHIRNLHQVRNPQFTLGRQSFIIFNARITSSHHLHNIEDLSIADTMRRILRKGRDARNVVLRS